MLRHWAIHSAHLWTFATFLGLFGGAKMNPKWPKVAKKNCFLVALDNFFCKNGPNDLVRCLFLSLDIKPYILPTCGPLNIFLGPLIRGAQMASKWPENHKKTVFRLFWTISVEIMGPMIWLVAYF
jgi:hypothetical protein